MTVGVAAGHPATADAGAEVLAAGGSAADAAVAACLASCVAETVMTGLLGGGHAIYFDAPSGTVHNLDCFVAVPGVDAEPRETALLELEVPFGTELVHYAVGIASCGVPGVPAGLAALSRDHGRLPWPRLVEPALALARDGVAMPPAHASCLAMLAPVMTMNEGAAIYAPAGQLLAAGDRLAQPGLVEALELLAAEGAGSAYVGTLADRLIALMEERGGLVTREDLRRYEARWAPPLECDYLGTRVLTRHALSALAPALAQLPSVRELDEPARVLALLRALDGAHEASAHTTNIVTVDGEGSACVLTTSLGLGSGDFVPGLDLHLNSMLGETDLVRGTLEPGARMQSMMTPTLVFDGRDLVLAAGAAGGTRLRTALVTVLSAVLDEGFPPAAAIERPRVHAVGRLANAEPGFREETLDALRERGFEVRVWPERHHYFGGVSAIGVSGAAGDPRRSGAARTL